QALGFFADGKLKTIALQGERPSVLAAVLGAAGGTWTGDVILVGQATGPIRRIPATGGATTPATTLRPNAPRRGVLIGGHTWPQFLPDRHHFIYTEAGGAVMLAALGSTSSEELLDAGSTGVYSAAGFLLFVPPNSTKLMAQP